MFPDEIRCNEVKQMNVSLINTWLQYFPHRKSYAYKNTEEAITHTLFGQQVTLHQYLMAQYLITFGAI